MNLRNFILLLVLALTSSGCINIFEDLFLNKDGSGRYVMKIDLSSMLNNPMMQGLMDSDSLDTDNGDLTLQTAMGKDTSFSFLAAALKSGKQVERPEFWEKVYFRTKTDQEAGEFYASFDVPFQDLSDISYFYENFNRYLPSDEENSEMVDGEGFMPTSLTLLLHRRTLSRKSTFMTASEAEMEEMNEEEMQMMRMFFSGAQYQTTYHLPGKVKKSEFPNAIVDGKTLTVRTPLLDVIEGKASLDGSVKFGRR